MGFTIRRPRVEEARAVAVVHVETWRSAYKGVVDEKQLQALDVEARTEMWKKALILGEPSAFVAVDDDSGVIFGFASFGAPRDGDLAALEAGKGCGELYAIYVDASKWRAGAGAALMGAVERELARSYREAALWVLVDNPRARAFYEKHGWRRDAGPHAERVVTAGAATGLVEIRYRKTLDEVRT
jgi:GNAT superfamily N-acetyltransferase